ncbi:MAG: chemotaxis protein CheD [bacterium]|nr:chemotaxis protein CheD [bacterium]
MKTIGLGSCVAVTLHDREKKIGGMIHFMLPSKVFSKSFFNPYKYCDTGLSSLIMEMEQLGARKYRMEAKLVGGANMFSVFIKNIEESIGYRNIEMAKKILRENRIPVTAEDTGSDYSRSVEFTVKTGIIKVTSYKNGETQY